MRFIHVIALKQSQRKIIQRTNKPIDSVKTRPVSSIALLKVIQFASKSLAYFNRSVFDIAMSRIVVLLLVLKRCIRRAFYANFDAIASFAPWYFRFSFIAATFFP